MGGEISHTCPDQPWDPPSLLFTMGTRSFPGVKSSQGVTLTPHPLAEPWSLKSRAIPLLPLWAVPPVQSLSACTRVHFTFTFGKSTRNAKLIQITRIQISGVLLYCIQHICRFHTLSCTTHLTRKIFWKKCNYSPWQILYS